MRKFLLIFSVLAAIVSAAQAQTRQISGKVADLANEPLIGVSVNIKGTTQGTITDVNGNFKINVSQPQTVLVVKYIGFKTKEVTVSQGQSNLSITLQEDVTSLKEVVVNIGYGQTVSREALSGSVSTVTAKQLSDVPVSTAAEAITGRLAGVQVTTTEGQPGAEIQITVRGGNSITNDNGPLYIVDGVQVENALSLLSPQEIQTIDVLKDAASTSIYGARGANGVVLITTKSGRQMKPQFTYNAFAGVRNIVNQLGVMSPYDFVNYQYEVYNGNDNDRNAFINRYGRYQDIDLYQNMPATNWQDELFGRSAFSQTHVLGLTGGTKKTTYNLTLNHADENGIMLNSGYVRTLASLKLDHKFTNQLKVGFTTRYSRQRVEGIGTSNSGSQSNNRLRNAVRYKPYNFGEDAEFDDTDLNYTLTSNLASPVLLAQNELKFDDKDDVNLTGYVSYDFLKKFNFRSTLGYSSLTQDKNAFYNAPSGVTRSNNANSQPVVELSADNGHTLNNSNTLSYKASFKKHNLNFLFGEETYLYKTDGEDRFIRWFPLGTSYSDAFDNPDLAVAPAGQFQDPTSFGLNKYTLLSFFGRTNYSYSDKYVATVSLRYDGSSKFISDNRFKAFPSASVAWRISQEPFMDKIKGDWLSSLKLRASYGTAGNNRIPNDLFVTLFGLEDNEGYAFNNTVTPAYVPNALANSNLEWELTVSRNLGLDVSFLNNRFNASFDLYQNNTNDLLLPVRIPSHSGWVSQIQNAGSTENKGIEFQLAANLIKNKNFSWTTNFNISSNRNKIVGLGLDPSGNPKQSYTVGSGWISSGYHDFLVEVGQPIGQFYGYVTDGRYGIDDFNTTNTNGTYTYTLKDGIASSYNYIGNRNPQPGDIKLKKLTAVNPADPNTYRVTENDRQVLGNAQPKFIGGLNQQFTFKGFDMSLYMNWSVGNKVYNANKIEFTSQYNNKDNNLLDLMIDRWQSYENGVRVTDPAKLQALNANTSMWNPVTGAYFLHSFAIEDGSFLRLNNLTLGYTLPAGLIKRTKLVSNLRIYATANNLWTITGYSGYDPEANTRRSSPLTPGVDYAAYPRSRYILAGLNVTF